MALMDKEAMQKAEKIFKIAETFRSSNDTKNAIEAYKRSIRVYQYNAMSYVGIALCYLELQKINKVEKNFDTAFKMANISGRSPQIKLAYATYLKSIGRTEKCLSYYKDCCDDENYPINIISFNYLTKYDRTITTEHKLYKKITQFFSKNSENIHREVKKSYYYALSRIYENMKNYKKAWAMLYRGNKLSTYRPVVDSFIKTNNLMRIFATEKFQLDEIKDYYLKENKQEIVFILGQARTGTTLVEKIISSHSNVFSLGENKYLENIIFNQEKLKTFYETNILKKKEDTSEETKKPTQQELMKQYLKTINHPSKDNYKEFAEYYLKKAYKLLKQSEYGKEGMNVFTDRSPDNILYIGYILCMFPNAKFILCERNFLDMAVSQLQTEYEDMGKGKTSVYYNQDSIIEQSKYFDECINYWKPFIKNRLHIVKYESLINHGERDIKKIINHCKLEWDDKCLEFYKQKSVIRTVGEDKVFKPLFNTSIGKWEQYKQYIPTLISHYRHISNLKNN